MAFSFVLDRIKQAVSERRKEKQPDDIHADDVESYRDHIEKGNMENEDETENISSSSRITGGIDIDHFVCSDHGSGIRIVGRIHSDKRSATSDSGSVCMDIQFR